MKISPDLIHPSQNYLKPVTVRYIFECLEKGDLDKLPPSPIVCKDSQENLIAIDGHNLIAVLAFLNQDVEVHLAGSALDGIDENAEGGKERNADLKHKFDTTIQNQRQIESEGISSFRDLISKYPELFVASTNS